MEHWRSFFNRAGEDIWTIIEQAIILAATDHPSQFREKRCEIAETLFARRPQQSETDVTRLSTISVVSNCANQMQTLDEPTGDHVTTQTKDGLDVKRQGVYNAERDHSAFCSVEPCNDGGGNAVLVSTTVSNIQKTLNDSMQTNAVLLQALRTLESLHISVDVLKTTEIGKQVNNLRKHACKEVGVIAKALVRRWKEIVDEWVMNNIENAIVAPPAGHTCGDGSIEEGGMFNETAHEMQGEFPEERGSTSRAELSGVPGRISKKPQLQGRDAIAKDIVDGRSNDIVRDRLPGPMNHNGGKLGPDASKRKASQDDTQVENAKKQHVTQTSISKGPPRGGSTRLKAAAPCFVAQRSFWN